jgi:hypothetical protein
MIIQGRAILAKGLIAHRLINEPAGSRVCVWVREEPAYCTPNHYCRNTPLIIQALPTPCPPVDSITASLHVKFPLGYIVDLFRPPIHI